MRRTYLWAVFSAFYVALASLAVLLISTITFTNLPIWFCFSFGLVQFGLVFFILNRRYKRMAYQAISEICSPILKSKKGTKGTISRRDIRDLKVEIRKFANSKNSEIEVLKNRDVFRREFIGDLSHELKTPIFTIQGYVLTLLDGAINDEKVAKNYLERAARGVERLTYIIEDLDTISKLELNKITLECKEFDLVELAQSVMDFLEMKAQEKQITLTFDTKYNAIRVYADRERIQQALLNLMTNSIKYGKKNGTTEVLIDVDKAPDKVLVKISDNGEGIESRNLPRIFERFFRVDRSRTRKEAGAGLGLSIVKYIIEAHNQNIYVKSIFGVGSEFSFTLQKPPKPKTETKQ